ncbi:4Fe-4S dicluster domain-containing protein [Candidatus Korarchaeum cryptofilum]|uniref:4Fe-4S dicluster domain-containing protein n=1 Tax=Candidatus Korarchaeum cryptofilum TaxID=498846 RepID=A0A3R9WZ39_9CREN|nr:4Fe-4S dicluster domain-containing protein [Candidatus Korarchaeum cryptofilum]
MRLEVVDPDICVGCMSCMFACSRRFGDAGLNYSAIQVRSVGGVERGFTVIVCRACSDPSCMKVCPTSALRSREGGGVILDSRLCIGCGYCVKACPFGAIFWDCVNDKPVICTHCGLCVDFCPYGVIKLGG